tara:strand:- start:705 stop:1910 length:1206 start_codon:yes stop_codon:yes gene_type:complete
MSEEAVAEVEAVAEEAAPETTPVMEEAAGFLDQETELGGDSDDSIGFLETIGNQLEEASAPVEVSEGEESVSATPEPETSEVTGEEPTAKDSDLAADFPEAAALEGTLDDKAVAKWGELRSELAEARAKAAELEANLDSTTAQVAASELEEQLSDARNQIQEYEKQLSVSRVEQSAEYKQVVTEPLQSIMDSAEALATRNELDVNSVFDALAETQNIDRQNRILEDLTAEMGDRDKMMLYRMVDDAAVIFTKDAQLKHHAAEAAAEIEQQESVWEQEALKQHAVETRSSINKVFDKLESVLPDFSEDMGDLRTKALSDDFLELGVDHQAYALSAGTMLPPMVKALRTKEAKIAELEKQLSSYQKATPKAAELGGGVQVAPADTSDSDGLDFMESITKRLGV